MILVTFIIFLTLGLHLFKVEVNIQLGHIEAFMPLNIAGTINFLSPCEMCEYNHYMCYIQMHELNITCEIVFYLSPTFFIVNTCAM